VHGRAPVDAIYSSSPPVSSHLAAALISSVTGLPWIADFRDPWIGNAFSPPIPAPHAWLRGQLERLIVNRADRSVLATGALGEMYVDRYPRLAHRFAVISNGYDLSELEGVSHTQAETPPRPFRLVYTGSIYGERELDLLLDGVEQLLRRRPSLGDELRVELVGWLSAENEGRAARRLPAVAPIVRHIPQVPRSEALAMMAGADAGLLLLAAGPGRNVFLGSKIFEYLGLDVPILAVAPEGEMRRVLTELRWGIAADPTPEGVAQGIEQIMDAPRPGRKADPDRHFERRHLSAALAGLLDEAVAARG